MNKQYNIFRDNEYLVINQCEIINKIPLSSIRKISKKIEKNGENINYKLTIDAGLKLDFYSFDEVSLEYIFNLVKQYFNYK